MTHAFDIRPNGVVRQWGWIKLGLRATAYAGLLAVLACSSGGGGPEIGNSCRSDSDCSGLSGGYCTQSGVCTRPCSLHADCGCASGTSNADLLAGKCHFACIDEGGSVGSICLKTCSSSSQCNGTQSCNTSNTGIGICASL